MRGIRLRVRARATACLLAASALTLAIAVSPGSAAPSSGSLLTTHFEGPCTPATAVTCVLNIPYGSGDRSKQTLDAYYPTNLTSRATVVMIHGGVWHTGTSRSFAPEAFYFAENGFTVFSINYTLAHRDKPSWPQVGEDVEAATAWAIAHAADFHGDGTRVGVLGGSSGGELAAYVDTAGPEVGVRPLAAVSWSGAVDFTITFNRGNKIAKHGLTELLGCQPKECPQTYVDASPVSHVSHGDGSLLLFHSSDERIPVAVAYEMARDATAAGVPHRLVIFKHSTKHARQYECDDADLDGVTLPVIDNSMRWLGDRLRQPTTPTGTFCLSH